MLVSSQKDSVWLTTEISETSTTNFGNTEESSVKRHHGCNHTSEPLNSKSIVKHTSIHFLQRKTARMIPDHYMARM